MATVADLSGNNGTVDTAVSLADSQLTALATKLDTLETSVNAVNTSIATTNTKLDTVNTTVNSVYPVGATPIQASSGNVADAAAVATFPAVANKTNYVTGITVNSTGATGSASVIATLVGALSGTLSFAYKTTSGAANLDTPMQLNFDPPIPASAVNTAMVLTLPALGAGNTHATVNMTGYYI